ncbi:MAG: peptide-methionine (S)-S-oxide reductase [Gammaproteobacteria bacterium]
MPATEFFSAEGYHQDYYKKNPVRYKFYTSTPAAGRSGCKNSGKLLSAWQTPAAMRVGLLGPEPRNEKSVIATYGQIS